MKRQQEMYSSFEVQRSPREVVRKRIQIITAVRTMSLSNANIKVANEKNIKDN